MSARSAAVVAAVLLMSACTTPDPPRTSLTEQVTQRAFIAAPGGGIFTSPVWVPATGEIIVSFTPAHERGRLYTLGRLGERLEPLPLRDDPGCRVTERFNPTLLSNGSVAFVQSCRGFRVVAETNELMAFDPVSRAASPLNPLRFHTSEGIYAVSPDLSRILLVKLTDAGRNRELLQIVGDVATRVEGDFRGAGGLSWSPDGRTVTVVTPVDRGDAQTLDLMSADSFVRRPLLRAAEIGRPSWSPDGRRLAVMVRFDQEEDEGLWLVDAVGDGGTQLVLRGGEIGSAAWSPDGRSLAVAVGISSGVPRLPGRQPASRVGVAIIDLPDPAVRTPGPLGGIGRTRPSPASYPSTPAGQPARVAVASDSECETRARALPTTFDRTVLPPSGRIAPIFTSPLTYPALLTYLAWSPDSSAIFFAAEGRLARIDAPSWRTSWIRYGGAAFTGVRVSPDGCFVITSDEHSIKLWSAREGTFIGAMTRSAHSGAAQISPDARSLVWIDGDTAGGWRIRIQGLASDTASQIDTPSYSLADLAISPDASHVVVSDLSAVAVYRLSDGARVREWFPDEGFNINAVAVNPHGTEVAMGDFRGTVRVWRFVDGVEIASFRAGASVRSLAFSADGTGLLVHHTANPGAEYWSLARGRGQRVWSEDDYMRVALDPTGRLRAVADQVRPVAVTVRDATGRTLATVTLPPDP